MTPYCVLIFDDIISFSLYAISRLHEVSSSRFMEDRWNSPIIFISSIPSRARCLMRLCPASGMLLLPEKQRGQENLPIPAGHEAWPYPYRHPTSLAATFWRRSAVLSRHQPPSLVISVSPTKSGVVPVPDSDSLFSVTISAPVK